jgi:N-acylglucosamine 2-epimerase
MQPHWRPSGFPRRARNEINVARNDCADRIVMNKNQLRRTYQELLLDGIVPFWAKHGVDDKFGGVLSCMAEDGKPISGDKYIWSQARWVWTCSALYNRIEKRPEFLKWARGAIDFLLAHGRDERGRWIYHATREGEPVEGAISIYSDCFAVYGLSEYCRAVASADLLDLARKTFSSIQERIEAPEFSETAPYQLPPNRRNHGVPMILTEVAGELSQTIASGRHGGHQAIATAADDYAGRVMKHFVRPARKCLVEFLDRNYEEVPGPEGTFIMPGHAIESMWFVMRRAMARGDRKAVRAAAEVMRWHLESGWDPEYGGIFLGTDAEGHPPFLPNSETKLWWPHTEALYGLLLAHELTGEDWSKRWFEKVYEWSFAHFLMPEVGEWRQRLDRTGKPITSVVALPVKDPFHLPRALILSLELLR